MTDREKGDHWGHLASVLGADAEEETAAGEQPQAEADVEAAPAESPAPSDQAAHVPPAAPYEPRRTRPQADWDALVSSLGIQPPPEAVAEPSGAPAADAPAAAEQAEEELDRRPPEPSMSTEELAETVENLSECLRAAPASLGHERTVLIAQETVAVFADLGEDDVRKAVEPGEGEGPREEASRRRPYEFGPDEKESGPDGIEPLRGEVSETEAEAGEEGDAEEKRRSKRRRPRRRRQKADMPDAKPDAKPGSKPEAEARSRDDSEDVDTEALCDMDGPEAGGEKPGHRSIPTWQDAIGVIIEKNMGTRSKKPSGGQSPRRGSRRSGRRGGG